MTGFRRTIARTADELKSLELDRIHGRPVTAHLSKLGMTTIARRTPVDRYGIDMMVIGPLGRDAERAA